MYIKQSYNNNIILVELDGGNEGIVVGTGIGFSKKPGDKVEEKKIKKIYYSEVNISKNFNDSVVSSADAKTLTFVENILEEVEETLKITVYSSLFVSFLEHFNNILNDGSSLKEEHPLRWIVKRVYPEIYEISKTIYEKYCQMFDLHIPRSEIVAIALHVINAMQNNTMPETLENTRIINEVLRILEYSGGFSIDKQDIDYSRFITHLEFLLNRLRSKNEYIGKKYNSINYEIYQNVFTSFKNDDRLTLVLEKMLAIIPEKYGEIGEAEKLFLLIHLVKMSS